MPSGLALSTQPVPALFMADFNFCLLESEAYNDQRNRARCTNTVLDQRENNRLSNDSNATSGDIVDTTSRVAPCIRIHSTRVPYYLRGATNTANVTTLVTPS